LREDIGEGNRGRLVRLDLDLLGEVLLQDALQEELGVARVAHLTQRPVGFRFSDGLREVGVVLAPVDDRVLVAADPAGGEALQGQLGVVAQVLLFQARDLGFLVRARRLLLSGHIVPLYRTAGCLSAVIVSAISPLSHLYPTNPLPEEVSMSAHNPRFRPIADHTRRFLDRLHRERTGRGAASLSFTALCDVTSIPRDLRAALLDALVGEGYVTRAGEVVTITPKGIAFLKTPAT
jgi:hypothetical protein